MTANSDIATRIAAIDAPADQYRELVEYNGRVQNMALRRMTPEALTALRDYAATQPKLPYSSANLIEAAAIRELRTR